MLSYADFKSALGKLELGDAPVIAHASLKSFGAIQAGAQTVLEALANSINTLVMPTFTYKTMVTPGVGPPKNGLAYGSDRDRNKMAESFHAGMPADPLMGILPETLRLHPAASRTSHPILSFAGINAKTALDAQILNNPFAPIGLLAEGGGWVLLMGVDQTANTSIHYGEKLAGRRQFIRWALAGNRVVECHGFPGCSDGFNVIREDIKAASRREGVGNSAIEAIPLQFLLQAVEMRIKEDPLALLCQREDCERCNALRDH